MKQRQILRRYWHPVLTGLLALLLVLIVVLENRDMDRARENRREFAAGALRLIEQKRGAELAGMLEMLELPLWQNKLPLAEYTDCYRQAVAGLPAKGAGQ